METLNLSMCVENSLRVFPLIPKNIWPFVTHINLFSTVFICWKNIHIYTFSSPFISFQPAEVVGNDWKLLSIVFLIFFLVYPPSFFLLLFSCVYDAFEGFWISMLCMIFNGFFKLFFCSTSRPSWSLNSQCGQTRKKLTPWTLRSSIKKKKICQNYKTFRQIWILERAN